ncbi:FtsW/RodA/SpoVE family cell cycle protein [Aureibacillus halotolerans]|uniref:Cell division protein FtsW (Lipid II flippase) n=1 Tax=Aureibacillus halotolerans TaxID=1508390 RepID=A0A4R6UBL8_9BACI|nr:FtsW/RodA/SpoVE family cell cycle protein [Aureibacillus halotolerans]TDQ42145.1 cell division protein FtsW (lipid II flippase) [Aureibacillus halotolerans]
MERDKTPLQQLDAPLLFLLFLLAITSLVAIQTSEIILPEKLKGLHFALKQGVWYCIGGIAVVFTMLIDFDRFRNFSWILYGFGMILLIGLFLNFPASVIETRNNATSWYSVPGGSFQPSELMKVFLIIVLAKLVSDHHSKRLEKRIQDDIWLLAKLGLATILPFILIMEQPDLGTGLVFLAILGSVLLVSGIRWRLLLLLASLAVLGVATLVFIYFTFPVFFGSHILAEYQINRFYGWLAPNDYASDEGFHLVKSLLAIGSGRLDGVGLNQLTVEVPEPHTDFIFSVIASQFGFVGGSIVISLFFMLIYRMIHIAIESHDPFGSYLCVGVIGMISFQVFQNIGMTIQVLPITGIPLPFISYGGSSLLTYMIAIGIVLNVRSRTKTFMFDSGRDN